MTAKGFVNLTVPVRATNPPAVHRILCKRVLHLVVGRIDSYAEARGNPTGATNDRNHHSNHPPNRDWSSS